jgi:predicted amidohydrolase
MAAAAGGAVLLEPQLLLVLGPELSLAGFPFFQTGGAQVYHLGPSRGAGRAALAAALARYSAALQRHGK